MVKARIEGVNKRQNSVERWVARWANSHVSNYDDGAAGALKDLLYGGCSSGMVGALIYTRDIEAFYRRHLRDVEAIVEELEESMGEPLRNDEKRNGHLDNVTFRTWVAVEETARKLADELGIES